MRINYDFCDLEAFLAVKEAGSFHLAADKLNLSQSAITRRIKKLEDALDSQLFERTTRAVKPTLAAKRLQARAEAMLDGARETSYAMRDESATYGYQKNAIVTVGFISSIAATLLPAALHGFRAEGHTARVRLLDGNANEVAEAVAGGEVDFGISSIPMLEPSTSFQALFDDQIVLAMLPSHRLVGQADEAEGRQPGRNRALDLDWFGLDAQKSDGVGAGDQGLAPQILLCKFEET